MCRGWAELSWGERWLVLVAWWLLLAVDLGLRMLPYPWVQGILSAGRATAPRQSGSDARAVAERVLKLVRKAARHHPCRPLCLRQALVAQWLLRRRGIPAELRLGVRKEGGVLAAHAWLEHEAKPVGERGLDGFVPLDAGHRV